ncbi:MAG: glycoside hydrolase family 3 C-terminal domain-containing protein [Tyzzerella sp.]|nr:glycoside hydrolase family 3 C-terminal domain-containing protein [Tyzzerella sp.]
MEENKKELRIEKKAQKKAFVKARRRARRPWKFLTLLSGPLMAIFIALAVVVSMFDNTMALFLGGTFWELENEDKDAIYYEGDYDTEEERIKAGAELVKQVEAEGATLLTNEKVNDKAALPLDKGAKVSLFSTSSVNIVYGGTGSANVDASKCDDLKTALEKEEFAVNGTLWDFYKTGAAKEYTRGNAGAVVQDSATAKGYGTAEIVEAPWDLYSEKVLKSVEEYGDAAIVVLSRIGGEGADSYFDHELKDGKNYLALNQNEKDMMAGIKKLKDDGKIKKIVVLINTSNALQVDFLKNNEYGVDATLWIGGVGQTGLNAVAEILSGEVNPSGSLPDTYCYDNYSSPVMQNFTPVIYKGDTSKIPGHADTYMIYQEGIYVGYKYYETRYEDYVMDKGNAGKFAYGDDVAFPFGYGLSYTNFEYSDMTLSYDKDTTTYTINVTVTNKGDVAGKETVQIYVSSPYTQYDIDNKIEKASVSLVGFEKTDILEPGASDTLKIEVDGDYVASYDAYGAGTYIMDAGDYYFTAATDAHNAANNVLAAKGYTPENTEERMDVAGNAKLVAKWNNPELDTTTYALSDVGEKIANRLDASDPNRNDDVDDIVYLTRNDWVGTMPSIENYKFEWVKDDKGEDVLKVYGPLTLDEYLIKALQDQQYETDSKEAGEMPTLGADNGLKLHDMIGLDYYDEKWDKLLDQLTFDEMVSLIGDSFHWTMPIESVQAPGTRDENGPQGLTVALFGSQLGVETTALTSEDVLAATFNKELVYEIGKIVGNDCLDAKVTFLYGPGANIHRSPYSGRNFEYYSEDGYLSSEIGRNEVAGIEEKGVRVVMKHFALNDCEQDRIGLGVWLNEQAAREIYLRAFQGALESSQAGGNGVMMAYTRWGTQWSGANEGLLKGIMNSEWNCMGLQITDNVLNSMVNGIDGVMGGTTTFDSMLAFMITGENGLAQYENDPVAVQAMKSACHHNLYAIANSQAMNGIGPDTTIKVTQPMAKPATKVLAIAFGALFVVSLVMWIIKVNKFKKTEAYNSYKEFKKSMKNK